VRCHVSDEFDPWAADSIDEREQRNNDREHRNEKDGKKKLTSGTPCSVVSPGAGCGRRLVRCVDLPSTSAREQAATRRI
jgi:hypothetical protein